MKFEIVQAADLPQIQSMYRAAFAPLYQRYHDEETDPYCETMAALTWKWQQPDRHYFFAVHEQRRVGMICLHETADPLTLRISPLLILPAEQAHGYAQALLLAIFAKYPAITAWQIDTIAQEAKLVYLYQKVGFVQLSDQATPLQPGMTIIYFEKHSADGHTE